jgi:uncharacterized membrane protein YccC
MDSEAAAGLIGVVLGAVLGTGGTWLVSTRLEARREKKRLCGVIALLASELEDNRERVSGRRRDEPPTRDWSGLTIGDWDANKATFSELMRDESLWKRVVTTYGGIYSAISGARDPPDAEELEAIANDLRAKRDELLRQVESRSSFGSKRS